MRDGVVVMLDALGFKGIWKPGPGETEEQRATQVLQRMKRLRQAVKRFKSPEAPEGVVAIECECISDTIVVGVWPNMEKVIAPVGMVVALSITSLLCDRSAREAPPLAYRGAVAVGGFDMEDGFFLGPAVDEAAGHMEQAEGAFVWLGPSALSFVQQIKQVVGVMAPAYAVPLKGGASFDTFAVTPWMSQDLGDQAKIAQTLLDTFDRPELSVQIKRQNTAKFLNMALAKSHACMSRPHVPGELKRPTPPENVPVVA